jgi:cell division transport system permease protein
VSARPDPKPAGPRLQTDRQAARIVPPSGPTAWLTSFTAGAMTFLAVFALALSLASGRLADRWSDALARTATIRISAPADQLPTQTRIVLDLLAQTPGIASARALEDAEQRALLEPWFGPDLPIEALPLPRLIEITEAVPGYDGEGLRLRLQAEAPGAVLDDHTRWRRPLAVAAERLRLLGLLSIALIGAAMAAMITLAANAALAANAQVIRVLRLVGARDSYIARAFVRRFTLRALTGSAVGAAAGMAGILLLPSAEEAGGFLTGLGFQGLGWLWPVALPPLAALVAFAATRLAAFRTLREVN